MAMIKAIYENGVFRPVSEVVLREGAIVEIVLPKDSESYLSDEELGYPKGFFEGTSGALMTVPLERPPQKRSDS
jgi:predicted DNA-binding antitoxin AbrB/MazE fold protein